MDKTKVKEVINLYRKKLKELKIQNVEFPDNILSPNIDCALAHCNHMLDKMEIFIQQDRLEKVFRWLGFIQGCLWSFGIYTLDDLKNDNRPKE